MLREVECTLGKNKNVVDFQGMCYTMFQETIDRSVVRRQMSLNIINAHAQKAKRDNPMKTIVTLGIALSLLVGFAHAEEATEEATSESL